MISTVISLVALAAISPDEPIERIAVQGQYRSLYVNEAPTSVSVLTADVMGQRHGTHMEDVLNVIPNLNFSSGSSRARFMQIRGIGERSQFVDPINPSVGILIDGINYSGLGQAAQLFDISQVEVYRGPQSGRFGADGMAGMLVLESTQPNTDFDGFWQLGAANYGALEGGFAAGGEVAQFGRARLSVYQQRDDGFTDNIYLNRDDTQARSERIARLNVWTELSADWQLRSTLHAYRQNNGYDAFSLDNTRETYSDEPGEDDVSLQAARFELTYSGADTHQTSVSYSVLSADTLYSYDEDWSYVGIAPGWEYSSTDAYWRDRLDHTLDIRWLSNTPFDLFGVPTDWVVGWYHLQRDETLEREFMNWDLGAEDRFVSDYDSMRNALYGELTHYFNPRWKLTTGLRLERYRNEYSDTNAVNAQPRNTMAGGRVSVSYTPEVGQLWYVTWSQGYKTGGVNGDALGKVTDNPELETFLLQRATFAPEYLESFEVGYKLVNTDDTLSLNLAAFHQNRDQVQLKSWVNRAQTFVGYIENAAAGTTRGIEAELNMQIQPSLWWFANVGLLDSEIRGFITEDGIDMTGREQAQAPSYQVNTGLNWLITDSLKASIQVDAKDSFYFSDSHNSQSDKLTLLHANLNWQIDAWRITLWGRNLADEDYATRGFYFGNDPRDGYEPTTYVQWGEPRRFGITFNYSM
ncbi:TonB-dependent receptor [Pseudidiomarina sp.]|uniref:TonB-dependent receptor n=1 Tax=Pseudidiomarina sp. TaxID=2081707 RepID=UPI003A97BDDF